MDLRIRPREKTLRWKRLKGAVRLFVPYLRENWRTMGLALSCGIGATLTQLLKPWPIKILFDGVLLPPSRDLAPGWLQRLQHVPIGTIVALTCGGLLLVSILWGLFSYGQTYLTARAGQAVVFSLRRRVYAHLQHLSLTFHQKRQRGDLLMRLTGDINVLRDMLVDALLRGTSALLLLTTMTLVLFLMDWRLSLVVLGLLPLLALTTLRFSVRIREAARRQRKNEGRVAALVQETLSGISFIQASGSQKYLQKQFDRSNRQSHKAGLRTTRLEASQSRVVEVLLAAGTAAVLWYGVHRVISGAVTPGDLLVFIAYVHSAFRPMRHLARTTTRLSKAVVCAERVTELLRTVPEVRDLPGAKSARRVEGRIEFRNVAFHYEEKRRALRGIDFEIEPGKVLGIVGPSGAGKSTVMALLLRLYEPDSGKILVDGRELRRFRIQSMRERIAVVLQESILFGSTVSENIAFGKRDATDEEIERAARLANAHEFIRRLPEGYETAVAEAGASLSGGQRQRLAIARAFLRDAPILLLDEPTFGIDPASEATIVEALSDLMRGRTTIMIAHRLATIRDAHRILVLDRGKVIESGSHEELVAANGWYAEAWTLQSPDRSKGPDNEAPPSLRVASRSERS
jgi:ABC-type multidrug transport system fused ATPase/permease subunit